MQIKGLGSAADSLSNSSADELIEFVDAAGGMGVVCEVPERSFLTADLVDRSPPDLWPDSVS